ncbi:MAG TPA: sugar phosphate isomerase/epimerase family protein [Geobacteraceae bacterium]|nr:sugar phosphate isomerase/epimerase family protein [Geobacteraceae bacterium]
MNNRLFVHVPYWFLQKDIRLVLERRVNPEVYLAGDAYDSIDRGELAAIAEALQGQGLSTTMHAPYADLNPGSPERLIREATLKRFHQLLDVAEAFRPRVIVLHPGYDRWRFAESRELWLHHSINTWREVLPRAEAIGCTLAVENVFEEEPSTLRALFEAVDSPLLRHCFDVGHWNLFVKMSMEEWFAEIGPWIAEAHIHDNQGKKDDHSAIGDGNIDFDLFFRLMGEYAPDAAWTLEAHSRETLEKALVKIRDYM